MSDKKILKATTVAISALAGTTAILALIVHINNQRIDKLQKSIKSVYNL